MNDRYRVNLTHDELQAIVSAMFDKAMESERYLRGTTMPDVPGPEDLCCDYHRRQYEHRKGIHDELQQRYEADRLLAETLEALIA